MAKQRSSATLPLPKGWRPHVKSALLHVVSLAYTAITAARAKAATSRSERVRLAGELERAQGEIRLLEEELRIKDARMAKVHARHRPHYSATDRFAILKLKSARGWSAAQVAERFLVRPATIAAWMRRLDEAGERALVRTASPINRFPEFVADVVQSMKQLCPVMGKKRIAQILARAGLHLGVTTVKRMLERRDAPRPAGAPAFDGDPEKAPVETDATPVRARAVHHIWQMDLTLVAIDQGLWTAWFPFALLPRWPFCWWVACVLDHHSRRVLDFAVFPEPPSAAQVCALLRRIEKDVKHRPKYLISDQGTQFVSEEMKRWCRDDVTHRFAAVGSLNATAVIERFFLSLKREALDRLTLSFRADRFRGQIRRYLAWYHSHRPHQGLGGRTPRSSTGEHPRTPGLDSSQGQAGRERPIALNRPRRPSATGPTRRCVWTSGGTTMRQSSPSSS